MTQTTTRTRYRKQGRLARFPQHALAVLAHLLDEALMLHGPPPAKAARLRIYRG